MVILFIPPSTSLGLVRVRGPQGLDRVKKGGDQSARRASDLHSSPTPFLVLPSSPTSCFGVGSPEEEGLTWEQPTAPPEVFSGPAHCPAPYTFSFEMLVTGPSLLAGRWSWPSRATLLSVADWEIIHNSQVRKQG